MTWSEESCRCRCVFCAVEDHYACDVHEDDNNLVGPGCSTVKDPGCALASWLNEVGSELIMGEGLTLFATLKWLPGEEYPEVRVTSK